MLPRVRRLAPALAVVLAIGAVPASAREAGTPTAGSAGIGDAYFPLDGNGGIDVLHYDVRDRYDFVTGRLTGRTTLTLRATQDLSRFNLDFLLKVTRVRVDGGTASFDRGNRHELRITPAQPLAAGTDHVVVVRYADHPATHSYAGEMNWLANGREVVAMNQPHMAPWWFPADDHPRDKARVRMSITVPRDQQVVGNGRQVGREVHGRLATTTWESAEPMVPYLAFFAAGRFAIERGRAGGRPWLVAVSQLLTPSERRVAMGLMRRTPALLGWLERQLGDYPFATVGGLTTSLQPGFALENQTRPTYPYLGDGAFAVSTVVHELAHQWFGDSVALASWRGIWLNEGAATFMEAFYAETHGGESAEHWLRSAYDGIDAGDDFWHHEVADPCPSHQGCVDQIFARFVYQRGGMALQALRNRIGDTDFWTLLRRWVAERRGGHGSTAQLEALAEQVSGEDLAGFFDAWLHTPSKPDDTADNGLG